MVQSTLIKRKAQVWSIDVIVGITIFLLALVLFYKFSINRSYVESNNVNDLVIEGKMISSYLVSTGEPEQWNLENVNVVGLTDGNMRIVNSKVSMFANLSLADYQKSRRLLSTTKDYYVYFESENSSRVSLENITSFGRNYSYASEKSLIKITRFVFYDSKIIKMVVLVW